MVGDRPGAGGGRPRRRRIRQPARRGLAAVVEHTRHVGHRPSGFGEPEDQVVVLGALQAVAKPPDEVEQRASGDEQAGDVVLAAQALR